MFETNPALANLESGDRLFQNGVILENVDGFEDPTNKFVLRGVPHVLSMKTSIARRHRRRAPPIRPSSAPAGAATARPTTARCASS